MSYILKIILILSITLHFSNAYEVFVQTDTLKLANITLSKNYCKNSNSNRRLCKSRKLSFIDYDDVDLPTFLRGIKTYISPILTSYNKDDIKASTLLDLNESQGDITGNWYDESSIELMAKTESTYTLSNTSEGYSGGAHGYYDTSFKNYDIHTQKELKLSDLFIADSNKILHDTALKYYKELKGLKPTDSLTDDGWFENNFVLAKNFAITPRGLLFYYNSYEIKSYADGSTQFMLPYSKIYNIISPKGPLGYLLNKPNNSTSATFENDQILLFIEAQYHRDYTITLTAKIKAKNGAERVWLSISLPQISSKKIILNTSKNNFDNLSTYDTHNKIYNTSIKRAKHAKYLLIEADKKKLMYEATATMGFKMKVPKQHMKELLIDVRATLQRDQTTYTLPNEYEGIVGQQGYRNHRLFLRLPN